MAELRAQLSQASLARPERPPPRQAPKDLAERETTCEFAPCASILLEVHQREKEERRQKHLIARLSRLWSRTGPR